MANEIKLIEYDRACWQIAKAKTSDEIGKIRDTARMMMACAKVVKNKQLEADAWEIRIRAERRLGQMLEETRINGERAGVGNPQWGIQYPIVKKPVLDEAGVDKNLGKKARRLARLEDNEFGIMIVDGRKNVENTEERSPQLKAKAKKKPKRELECPHCGKPVYLKDGRLQK